MLRRLVISAFHGRVAPCNGCVEPRMLRQVPPSALTRTLPRGLATAAWSLECYDLPERALGGAGVTACNGCVEPRMLRRRRCSVDVLARPGLQRLRGASNATTLWTFRPERANLARLATAAWSLECYDRHVLGLLVVVAWNLQRLRGASNATTVGTGKRMSHRLTCNGCVEPRMLRRNEVVDARYRLCAYNGCVEPRILRRSTLSSSRQSVRLPTAAWGLEFCDRPEGVALHTSLFLQTAARGFRMLRHHEVRFDELVEIPANGRVGPSNSATPTSTSRGRTTAPAARGLQIPRRWHHDASLQRPRRATNTATWSEHGTTVAPRGSLQTAAQGLDYCDRNAT